MYSEFDLYQEFLENAFATSVSRISWRNINVMRSSKTMNIWDSCLLFRGGSFERFLYVFKHSFWIQNWPLNGWGGTSGVYIRKTQNMLMKSFKLQVTYLNICKSILIAEHYNRFCCPPSPRGEGIILPRGFHRDKSHNAFYATAHSLVH